MIRAAIDLGKTGALTMWVDDEPSHLSDLVLNDDGTLSARWLHRTFQLIGVSSLAVEAVHAMPFGTVASFSMGHQAGTVRSVAEIAGVRLVELQPPAWRRAVGLQPGDDKEAARRLALRLWPRYRHELARKKDHNRAEALLIGLAAPAFD